MAAKSGYRIEAFGYLRRKDTCFRPRTTNRYDAMTKKVNAPTIKYWNGNSGIPPPPLEVVGGEVVEVDGS
jgi:hypothetical protein